MPSRLQLASLTPPLSQRYTCLSITSSPFSPLLPLALSFFLPPSTPPPSPLTPTHAHKHTPAYSFRSALHPHSSFPPFSPPSTSPSIIRQTLSPFCLVLLPTMRFCSVIHAADTAATVVEGTAAYHCHNHSHSYRHRHDRHHPPSPLPPPPSPSPSPPL